MVPMTCFHNIALACKVPSIHSLLYLTAFNFHCFAALSSSLNRIHAWPDARTIDSSNYSRHIPEPASHVAMWAVGNVAMQHLILHAVTHAPCSYSAHTVTIEACTQELHSEAAWKVRPACLPPSRCVQVCHAHVAHPAGLAAASLACCSAISVSKDSSRTRVAISLVEKKMPLVRGIN